MICQSVHQCTLFQMLCDIYLCCIKKEGGAGREEVQELNEWYVQSSVGREDSFGWVRWPLLLSSFPRCDVNCVYLTICTTYMCHPVCGCDPLLVKYYMAYTGENSHFRVHVRYHLRVPVGYHLNVHVGYHWRKHIVTYQGVCEGLYCRKL